MSWEIFKQNIINIKQQRSAPGAAVAQPQFSSHEVLSRRGGGERVEERERERRREREREGEGGREREGGREGESEK
jgi:hypothetical protein